MKVRFYQLAFFSAIAIVAIPSQPALAYIDPGAGSYILQIVIGTALAGLYLITSSWKNLTEKMRRFFKRKTDTSG